MPDLELSVRIRGEIMWVIETGRVKTMRRMNERGDLEKVIYDTCMRRFVVSYHTFIQTIELCIRENMIIR